MITEHDVPCPMPDCEHPLYLTWESAYGLSPTDLTDYDGLDPHDAHSQSWRVECTDGHVVLVPGPTGCGCDDTCAHDPDEYDWSDWSDDTRQFRARDAARLRDLLSTMGGVQ
jgi:hypothetical protein